MAVGGSDLLKGMKCEPRCWTSLVSGSGHPQSIARKCKSHCWTYRASSVSHPTMGKRVAPLNWQSAVTPSSR